VASKSIAKLKELGFTIMPHPAYSPDLSPSDYYLFSAMKSVMKGTIYDNTEQAQREIEKWCQEKPVSFYADGILMLTKRWGRCVEHNGEYFEHLY
jgi:transposase